MKKLHRNQDGATALEFALVVPTLLLITFAIIEYSLIMFSNSALESATNQVARFGQTGTDYTRFGADDYNAAGLDREAFLRQTLADRSAGLIDANNVRIETQTYADLTDADVNDATANDANGFGIGGEVVLYRVTYDWPVMTPFMGELIGNDDGNIEISTAAIVRNENF